MNRLSQTLIRSAVTIILVIAAALAAIWMWNHYERSPWTRDGRVRADVVRVTPDISGLVTSVAVRDNQRVKAGDLLFVIDTPRYRLALEEAEAQIASAKATLAQARREATWWRRKPMSRIWRAWRRRRRRWRKPIAGATRRR